MSTTASYIAYLETLTIQQQEQLDQLKAAALVLVMKMNCNRDLTEAMLKLNDLCKDRSDRVTKLIQKQY